MKTLISTTSSALEPSSARALMRLFAAGGLLALAACGGIDGDETKFTAEPGDDVRVDEAVDGNLAPVPAGEVLEDGLDAVAADRTAMGRLEQPLFGSDTCSDVDLRIQNSLGFTITVQSVNYHNESEGRVMWEDLDNRTMNSGAMEFWTPNLGGTENDNLLSWDVIFQHGDHTHTHHVNTPDQRCAPQRVYYLELL